MSIPITPNPTVPIAFYATVFYDGDYSQYAGDAVGTYILSDKGHSREQLKECAILLTDIVRELAELTLCENMDFVATGFLAVFTLEVSTGHNWQSAN